MSVLKLFLFFVPVLSVCVQPVFAQDGEVTFRSEDGRTYFAKVCQNVHGTNYCNEMHRKDQINSAMISIQLKLIAAIEKNTAAINALQSDANAANLASNQTSENILELSKEIKRQNTTALNAIQGQLLTKLDAIPITMVNDEQVYQALKKRLVKDIGDAFDLSR